MYKVMFKAIILFSFVLVLGEFSRNYFSVSPVFAQEPDQMEFGPILVLKKDPSPNKYFVPPPKSTSEITIQSIPFNIKFNDRSSCEEYNNLTGQQAYSFSSDWPDESKKSAAYYAAGIWSSLLSGTQPLDILACWGNLKDDSTYGLGSGLTTTNFNGAPIPNTKYPVSLAKQFAQQDLTPGSGVYQYDFVFIINDSYSFYDGLDGGGTGSEMDLVTAILHELGHGLGFSGSARVELSSSGLLGWVGDDNGVIDIY